MKSDLFGDLKDLPKELDIELLTTPRLVSGPPEEYEDVEIEEEGEDVISEMASSGMEELEKEVNHEYEDTGGQDSGFDLGDLEAEMILEIWEDLRENAHTFVYNNTIYKGAKEAKKLVKKLSMKEKKTPKEVELTKALWDYIEKCDECKGKYTEAIPYSGKHKDLCIRFIEYQIKKLKAQGKKVPEWIMWAYIFIAPEVKMLNRMFLVKDEIPEFKFDATILEK